MQSAIPERKSPSGDTAFALSYEPLIKAEGLVFEPMYYKMGLGGAVSECFVRQAVLEQLKLAQSFLPRGYRLKLWDCWRPYSVQLRLYEDYRAKLALSNPGLSEGELDALARRFVSAPVRDYFNPPVHTTGGAADLTVIDETGAELDMGTGFDHFGPEAETAYFERPGRDEKIRDNRRMLYWSMVKAGFTNRPSEWWHYDYGDRFWAYYAKKPAFYSGWFEAPPGDGAPDEDENE